MATPRPCRPVTIYRDRLSGHRRGGRDASKRQARSPPASPRRIRTAMGAALGTDVVRRGTLGARAARSARGREDRPSVAARGQAYARLRPDLRARASGERGARSPGSIYPTLQMLEDEEMVTSEERDGKRVFSITEAGKAELEERRARGNEAPPWEFDSLSEGVSPAPGMLPTSSRPRRSRWPEPELRHSASKRPRSSRRPARRSTRSWQAEALDYFASRAASIAAYSARTCFHRRATNTISPTTSRAATA